MIKQQSRQYLNHGPHLPLNLRFYYQKLVFKSFPTKITLFKIAIIAKIGHISELAIITKFKIVINAKIGHISKLAIFLPKNCSKLPLTLKLVK